mmetsp:Transcript_93719/g.289063  ORF Transcript_93719/g.289063 Transcript_93719/m.289063 type:complete len:157 (+) Transcript_93719:112-582(+)
MLPHVIRLPPVNAEDKGLPISHGSGEALESDARLHASTPPVPRGAAEEAPEGTAQLSVGSDGSAGAAGKNAPCDVSRPKVGLCWRRSDGRLGMLAARRHADAGILARPSTRSGPLLSVTAPQGKAKGPPQLDRARPRRATAGPQPPRLSGGKFAPP